MLAMPTSLPECMSLCVCVCVCICVYGCVRGCWCICIIRKPKVIILSNWWICLFTRQLSDDERFLPKAKAKLASPSVRLSVCPSVCPHRAQFHPVAFVVITLEKREMGIVLYGQCHIHIHIQCQCQWQTNGRRSSGVFFGYSVVDSLVNSPDYWSCRSPFGWNKI